MERLKRVANKLEAEIKFKQVRMIIQGIFLLSLCGVILYLVSRPQKVAVVYKDGSAWIADELDRHHPQIVEIEADNHITMFYGSLLTFNSRNYKQQAEKSATLGGNSVKEFYNTLSAKGFYNNISRSNYNVVSRIDSTNVQTDGTFVKVVAYGKMTLENEMFREVRKMDMQFLLRFTDRVKVTNPHGMDIVKLELLDNSVIKEY